MFCKHCGKPIEENAAYCAACGKQVSSAAVKTKDSADLPAESFFKIKLTLLELSLAKLLGFLLILSAAMVIGASFISSYRLSDAMQPPFLLIPIAFIFGLCVIFINNYNLSLVVGSTLFFLIIYFLPNPLTGGFFYFARLTAAIYQNNEQRLFSLISYSGSLVAIVTCFYLGTVGILSHKDFYARAKTRGLISLCILIGFLFLFTALPFAGKLNAGARVSNTGIGGASPGDIFLNAYTGSDWVTNVLQVSQDQSSQRWVYEFKMENKRTDGKETIIEKIISNKGEIPLDEENIKVQGAVLNNNQIIIPQNTPVVLTLYSFEPFYSLRIHTDKLDADFLFIN
jgi:hypothetical protein